jgi:enoyl-CoA hydratase
VAAGFLDRMVPASEVARAAREVAAAVSGLDMAAHAATKLRARHDVPEALRAAIEADDGVIRARAS